MEKEFIPYEQALALKELGFDEPCFGWYNPQVNYKEVTTDRYWAFHLTGEWENFKPAPLYQQVFRWFREKHNLHSYIEGAYPWFRYYVNSDDDRWEGFKHLTHEEAESACLDELIEIVRLTKP
jgi:hypothetical protein